MNISEQDNYTISIEPNDEKGYCSFYLSRGQIRIGDLHIDFISDNTIYVTGVNIYSQYQGKKLSLLLWRALFKYADSIDTSISWTADPLDDRFNDIKNERETNEDMLFEYYTLKHKLATFYQTNLEHDHMIPDGEIISIKGQNFEKGELGFLRSPKSHRMAIINR